MSFTVLLGPIALALVLHPLGNAVPWLKTVPTTLTLLMTTIIFSFFLFRHVVSWILFSFFFSSSNACLTFHHVLHHIFVTQKHVAIRKHYATAIARLEQLSSSAYEFDSQLSSRIHGNAEYESQNDNSSENDRLADEHAKSVTALKTLLQRYVEQYQQFIDNISPYVDQAHKSRLFDMYNIDPILQAGFSEEDDLHSAEYVGKLAQQLHWKRRECMTQLLALNIMTEDIDSNGSDYEKTWSVVNTWLEDMLLVARANTKKVAQISYCEPGTATFSNCDSDHSYHNMRNFYTSVSSLQSKELLGMDSQLLLHKLSSLDRDMRRVRDKMQICQNEIRAGSLNPHSKCIAKY